jgi:hypothetical protein
LSGNSKVVSCLWLAHCRNVRSPNSLGDILLFNSEISSYSASTARSARSFLSYWFEVLTLALLRKGDAVGLELDQTAIELEGIARRELLSFLN